MNDFTDRKNSGRRWYDSISLKIIGGLFFILYGCILAWAAWVHTDLANQRDVNSQQDVKIEVIKTEMKHIHDDVKDIKTEQKAMYEDIKRVLPR